jgi:26S proteasome regulatory subunit N6
MAELYSQLDTQQYRVALTAIDTLLKELKRLDDKIILTEVYLLESRAAHAIQNLPRAKVGALHFERSSPTD